jgi:DNA modification methylase
MFIENWERVNINEITNIIKSKFNFQIEDAIFFNILFEMHRYFDKQFVKQLHDNKLILKQDHRNNLRLYFYYGDINYIKDLDIINFPQYHATIEDKQAILQSFLNRCEKYNKKLIIKSIEERYNQITKKENNDNYIKWLNYYNNKRNSNSEFSLFIFDYSQECFINDNYDIDKILNLIADIYSKLENYRYFIFKLNGKLFNKNKEDVTWKTLYKIGIFCENFIQFKGQFSPFKKEKQIITLQNFLNSRYPFNKENNKNIAENFYEQISTGFIFEDCLISNNQETILLTYKKIKLDLSPIPCPSCMTTIQAGNSFPQTFLRSYECKNPSCRERSKSGRGKRFDEYGVYRFFKLTENKIDNVIDSDLYHKWRRDIFYPNNDIYEMLLKYYSWDNETIYTTKNIVLNNTHKRNFITYTKKQNTVNYTFNDLPICKLFDTINNLNTRLYNKKGIKKITNKIELINDDSKNYLSKLKSNQIGAAITSPPYYNAREYSSWSNLLLYLIDMMSNAHCIYNSLQKNGYYLYNIGDIVDSDNIYINSNMSKKRLQLGFLSSLVFEKLGFNLVGNIIWDKGEVQSKRNSTINHFSGYLKCINSYEHVLIFKKGKETQLLSDVKRINPVIKINSKGENLYTHTAPFPLEIANLIKPFINEKKYVLDPFLGSGTTLRWCKDNNIKGVGIELNKEYYTLAKKNINL